MRHALELFLFQIYPYIALTVFFFGCLLRFDRDQYTWKSDSSQLLRAGQLRWGSNLFHIGILGIFAGHFVGMLTPHALYEPFVTAGQKQVLAVTAGGLFGVVLLAGLLILIHRRLSDPRIRHNSRKSDIFVLFLLLAQVCLGLSTLHASMQHANGSAMLLLTDGAQRIVTFRPVDPGILSQIPWQIKTHIVLGTTIFLVFPFTRFVHVWSGFASVFYMLRAPQVVRSRKLGVMEKRKQA